MLVLDRQRVAVSPLVKDFASLGFGSGGLPGQLALAVESDQ